jgi:hypothetical protein
MHDDIHVGGDRMCIFRSAIMLALMSGILLPGVSYAQPPGVLWTYTYPGGCEWAGSEAVMQPCDGGCTAFGTIVYGMYSINTLIVRLDSAGVEQWSTEYQGGFSDGAVTEDGGYVFATTYMPVHGSEAIFYRLSADGSLVWKRYLGGEFGMGNSADQTPDGGFILCGQDYNDGTLWRTDPAGNIQWTRTWLEVDFYDVLALQDGCLVVAGRTTDKGEGLLIKTDSLGSELWSREFSGCTSAISLIGTADGGFAFVGTTSQFLLVKVDPQGVEQWRASFPEPGGLWASSVEQTWDNGYIISGVIENGIVEYCPLIIRTDSSGGYLWQESFLYPTGYNAPFADEAADGGYFVAGMDEFRVIRLAPGLGIGEEDGAELMFIGHPSPNPFSTAVQVSYSLAEEASVAASVCDLSGRCVAELTEGCESPGQHSLSWNGTDASGETCPAGVYLVRVSAGPFTETCSVVLLD